MTSASLERIRRDSINLPLITKEEKEPLFKEEKANWNSICVTFTQKERCDGPIVSMWCLRC